MLFQMCSKLYLHPTAVAGMTEIMYVYHSKGKNSSLVEIAFTVVTSSTFFLVKSKLHFTDGKKCPSVEHKTILYQTELRDCKVI